MALTDDSATIAPVNTLMGDRYNIVSGTLGTAHTAAATRTYGFFYPDVGAWILSAGALSSSIPGPAVGIKELGPGDTAGVVSFRSGSHLGFGVGGSGSLNENNALRLINCVAGSGSIAASDNSEGGYLQIRSEEVQQSVSYFCRVLPSYMNFSNNPTFVSGSMNELRHTSMHGDPQVFITALGLYDNEGIMVATANLSKPIKKNFSTEATVKVKLTF